MSAGNPPIVWIDRGEAVHGTVGIRTVWQWIGDSYRRTAVHALIISGNFTRLAPIYERKAS